MARARIATHLSLDRYAGIMGINPVHFAGAAGNTVWPFTGSCGDIWPQHSWQHIDVVSREDVAEAIHDAEEDIRRVLRRPVAPEYVVDIQPLTPLPGRNGRYGLSAPPAITTMWRDIQAVGRRGLTLLAGGADVVRTDGDGDTYAETMTVVILAEDLPTSLDLSAVKVYFPDKDGLPEWEIRPVTKRLIDGDLVITFSSWLLFDPVLWERSPSLSLPFGPIDADDTDSYLDAVDVYTEGVSTTLPAAAFNWRGRAACGACDSVGCAECQPSTQAGCVTTVNSRLGILKANPAIWNEDDEVFQSAGWAVSSYMPDEVTLYYKTGMVDDRYALGLTDDPLSQYLAQAIAWLATARLEAPPCSCGVALKEFQSLQHDMAVVDRSRGVFFSVLAPDMITNPFGTRRGEVRAWDRVSRVMAELSSMVGGVL